MRLIDADELLEDVRQNSQSYWADDFAYEWVNRQPTVDAIPVEWIEKYLRNYRYMAPIEKNFVREMIKAWAEREEE